MGGEADQGSILPIIRLLPRFISLVWSVKPRFAISIALVRIGLAFAPLSLLWVGKLLIDKVIEASSSPAPDWAGLLLLVGVEFLIVVAMDVLGRAGSLLETLLAELTSNTISVRIMEIASGLPLERFEDPSFYNQLQKARQQGQTRTQLLWSVIGIGQQLLTLSLLLVALVTYNFWLLSFLVLAVIPSVVSEQHFAGRSYGLFSRWTEERRRLDYLSFLATSDTGAKEIKLYSLSRLLISWFSQSAHRYYRENRDIAVRRAGLGAALGAISGLAYYGALAFLVFQAGKGNITVGTFTFLAGSFGRSRSLIQGVLLGLAGLYEQGLYLQDLYLFLDLPTELREKGPRLQFPKPMKHGFELRGLSYRYPDSPRWALRDVSLKMRPGETIALVGENGAGKTTLLKILTGLYQPTEGEVLLDGRRLSEYEPTSLWDAVGVVFQDFVKYDMLVRENIGFGSIESLKDEERIRNAASKGLANDLIKRLDRGFDQMLGRRFRGGVKLSEGEWQRIALSRAHMAHADLLILDEPTGMLDPRAERDFLRHVREPSDVRITLIITHRFSTVRNADRIVVLESGRIVESGRHEDLMAKADRYAELYLLQAAGYK